MFGMGILVCKGRLVSLFAELLAVLSMALR